MLDATSGIQSVKPKYNSVVNALNTPTMSDLLDSFLPYVGSNTQASNPYTYGGNTTNNNSSYWNALAGWGGGVANSSYNNGAYTSNNTNYWGAMGGYGGSSSSKPYSFLNTNTDTHTADSTGADCSPDYSSDDAYTKDLEEAPSTQEKKNNLLLLLGGYFSNKPKITPAPVVEPDPPIYTPDPPPAPTPAPAPKPEPKPEAPIAANQHTAYWGDPHVADADRLNQSNTKAVNFDVQGKGTYNLLTDKGVVLNAEHKEWGDPAANKDKGATPYVVGKVDLSLGDQKLALDDKGNATLNGKAIEKDKPVTATDGTVVKWDGNKLEAANANKGEYNMSFTLNKSTDEKGNNTSYIDTNITSTAKGVNSDGVMPTGILGEGFDADKNVRTELKHDQATYKVADGKTPEADAKEAPKADAKEAPKADAKEAPKADAKEAPKADAKEAPKAEAPPAPAA